MHWHCKTIFSSVRSLKIGYGVKRLKLPQVNHINWLPKLAKIHFEKCYIGISYIRQYITGNQSLREIIIKDGSFYFENMFAKFWGIIYSIRILMKYDEILYLNSEDSVYKI